MTTDLQTRIAAIKAECEEILKLSEKATAGPWKSHVNWVTAGPHDVAKTLSTSKEDDASFIAHARNVSPAMARVVIAAIDMLSIQAEIGTGAGVRQHAINAFDAIIAAWSEELL